MHRYLYHEFMRMCGTGLAEALATLTKTLMGWMQAGKAFVISSKNVPGFVHCACKLAKVHRKVAHPAGADGGCM